MSSEMYSCGSQSSLSRIVDSIIGSPIRVPALVRSTSLFSEKSKCRLSLEKLRFSTLENNLDNRTLEFFILEPPFCNYSAAATACE